MLEITFYANKGLLMMTAPLLSLGKWMKGDAILCRLNKDEGKEISWTRKCGRGKTSQRKPEREKEENCKVLKKPRAKSASGRRSRGAPAHGRSQGPRGRSSPSDAEAGGATAAWGPRVCGCLPRGPIWRDEESSSVRRHGEAALSF